jgi:4-alpha-glucanotransferase
MFRVDHVIGAFRVFTIPVEEPAENVAKNGSFDPADELLWEEHGRRILQVMLDGSDMLPCGEDLGVVPPVARKVMAEWAVPGLEVQRWTRDWKGDMRFFPPGAYRKNAAAVVSTHDSSIFLDWWRKEAEADEKTLFLRFAGLESDPGDDLVLLRCALERAAGSSAVFSIQLIQDYLALGGLLPGDPADWRVNLPGTVGPKNWSCVLPLTLEEMLALPLNAGLRELHKGTDRA